MSTYEDVRLKELENNPERLRKLLQDNEKLRHLSFVLKNENEGLRAQINHSIGTHWVCSFQADIVTEFGKKIEFNIDHDTVNGFCEDERYDWSSDLDTLIYLATEELVKGLKTGTYYWYLEIQSAWSESGWETIEYDCDPVITFMQTQKVENVK